MNILDSLFAWFTVASIRGSLLALAVIALQAALRGRLPARWRYALWLPVVFVLGAPLLPQSRWSLENQFARPVAPLVSASPGSDFAMAAFPEMDARPPTPVPAASASAFAWRPALAAGWLAGVVGMLVLAFIGYARVLRRIVRGQVPAPPEVAAMLREMAPHHTPRLLVSTAVESPAVTGFLRPTLLLPATFPSAFTREEARLVLLHELTHLRRYDLPVNWLLGLLQALHWCNPVLWFAFARMRADREAACDAQVLAATASDCRADYGHALLKLEGVRAHPGLSLGFVGIFEPAAGVRARVRAIAAHRPASRAWSLLGVVLISVLALVGATRAQEQNGNQPAANAEADPGAETEASRIEELKKKMSELVIPKLILRDATVQEALDFLHAASIELDPEPDPAKRGVRFNLKVDPDAASDARITVSLTNIPLFEAARYVTSLAGLKFRLRADGVLVVPEGWAGELLLKEWKVTPKVLSRLEFKPGGDAKELLTAKGVQFPKGSAAALVGDDTRLVMRTTQEQIDLVEAMIHEAEYPEKPAGDPKVEAWPKPRAEIIAKLERIVLPELVLRNATLQEAIELLKKRSVELDTAEPAPASRGVSMILKLDTSAENDATPAAVKNPGDARLNLSLRNVSLGEALRYVTSLAGMKYRVEIDAVSIVPLNVDTTMLVTKQFRLDAKSADRLGIVEGGDSPATVDALKRAGVEFPPNAAAIYLPASRKLIMRNTQENLDRFEVLAYPPTPSPAGPER